jgi:hypothetical protein
MIPWFKKVVPLFFYYKQGSELYKHAWFWYKNVDHIFRIILIGQLHFSDKQIFFNAFYKIWHFSEISGNEKLLAGTFCTRGHLTRRGCLWGPRPRRLASLARSAWAVAQTTGFQAPPAAGHGGGYGVGRGGRKGAARQGAHREPAGGVGLAGGWTAATNLAAGTSVFQRGIQQNDGDSRRGASILRARRKRAALQTFSARRRGRGSAEWRP